VVSDDGREQPLALPREARHVGVLDEVGAVALVAGVGQGEAYLVEAGGPAQPHARGLELELPLGGDVGEQGAGGPLDRGGVAGVDVVALGHRADGEVAGVLVAQAPDEVVEHALAERAVGVLHAGDAERAKDGAGDGEAAGEHGRAIGAEADEAGARDVAGATEAGAEGVEAVGGDPRGGPAVGDEEQLQRAEGAGRAEGLVPAQLAKGAANRLELLRGGELRPSQRGLGDAAVREIAKAPGHAAHEEALGAQGLVALADDALRGAAADVDHQPPRGVGVNRVRHAEIDQPGLFAAGDDLDGVAQRGLGLGQELRRGVRPPKRVRPHRAHLAGPKLGEALAEAVQARQRARPRLQREVAGLVEARRQPHGLLEPIEDLHVVLDYARHDGVKAIGTKVHSGDGLGRARIHGLPPRPRVGRRRGRGNRLG
jgi:hypothetical protein